MKEAAPQVLYIMGTARSGTTILEILLANNPGVAGVGEVTHLFRDGFLGREMCSCGQPASSCELWGEVRAACGWSERDYASLAALFDRFAWHTRFPGVAMNRLPPGLVERFRQTNECIFRAVAGKTRARVIVDSSKYAARALVLARLFPERVRVICLTRSPAGLLRAFARTDAAEQRPKTPWATLAYYAYVLACFRVVYWLLGPRVLQVRYEDLQADAAGTLRRIGAWAGFDTSSAADKIARGEWLEVGHIVTGNRLRRQGRVQFRPSPAAGGSPARGLGAAGRLMEAWKALLGF